MHILKSIDIFNDSYCENDCQLLQHNSITSYLQHECILVEKYNDT